MAGKKITEQEAAQRLINAIQRPEQRKPNPRDKKRKVVIKKKKDDQPK